METVPTVLDPDGILVSTHRKVRNYPKSEWKRAITAFLDDIWSQGINRATGAILFGKVSLYTNSQGYNVTYPSGTEVTERPRLDRHEIHAVTCEQHQVEIGLARFVRCPHIRMLVIEFGSIRLMMWKGMMSTDFHYTVVDRTF